MSESRQPPKAPPIQVNVGSDAGSSPLSSDVDVDFESLRPSPFGEKPVRFVTTPSHARRKKAAGSNETSPSEFGKLKKQIESLQTQLKEVVEEREAARHQTDMLLSQIERLVQERESLRLSYEQEIEDLKASIVIKDQDVAEMSTIFDQVCSEKEEALAELAKANALLSQAPAKQLKPSAEAKNMKVFIPDTPKSGGLGNMFSPSHRALSDIQLRRQKSSGSMLLTDAANYFQANLEVNKRDFRIEQLEGLLAKAEMQGLNYRTKSERATTKLQHLERENQELVKAKDAAVKELAVLRRRGSASLVQDIDTDSEHIFKQWETEDKAYVQELTALLRNVKISKHKSAPSLAASILSVLNVQSTHADEMKNARAKGEKPTLTHLAAQLSQLEPLLHHYLAQLSSIRQAAGYDELARSIPPRPALDSPLMRVSSYLKLLQALQPTCIAPEVLNEVVSKWGTLINMFEQTRQQAGLALLQSKLYGVPDSFKPGRSFQDESLMWQLFEQQGDAKVPLSHPIKIKEAESVRVFLFNDMLLITTLEYKYRYRLDFDESQVSPLTMLCFAVSSDLFTSDDLKVSDEDVVWPAVPTWETETSCRACAHNLAKGLLSRDERKHNCRLCGHSFCFKCTAKTLLPLRFEPKPSKKGKPSRVCVQCNDSIKKKLGSYNDRGESLIDAADCAGTITVLQCASTSERDAWVNKIRAAIELRKQQVGQKLLLKGQQLQAISPISNQDGVRVFMRIRPFVLDVEKTRGDICLTFENKVACLNQRSLDEWRADKIGCYDKIWGPESLQAEVYEDAGKPIVQAVLSGVNCAVLCYGNTGSGKTYTLVGSGNKSGLIPKIIGAILAPSPDHVVSAKMAYVQVYNGRVEDLQHTRQDQPAELVKDKAGKYNMYFTPVLNAKQAMMALLKGNEARAIRSHQMNDVSSRSHALCLLQVKTVLKNGKVCESILQLVDLAGSENTVATGVDKEGVREAIEINKSLISLGRVIHALNENTKRTKGKVVVVPFRENPLTMILKEVLEGRFLCHVILNCSCSSALEQARQTAKTMAFGDGLRKLGNRKLGKM